MNAQTKKQRIAQLLASGLTAGDVKLVVGVSDGYLKRLKEDEEFNTLLRAYAAPDAEDAEAVPEAADASRAAEESRLEDRYAVLESKVVNQLIANAAMADTKELVNILNTVSKQRGANRPVAPGGGGTTNIQVNLSLPASALGADALQLSSTNEVVAVQGQSLAAMDTNGAQKLLEQARAKRTTQVSQPSTQEVYHDL